MFTIDDRGFAHMEAMIDEFGLGTAELADEAAEMAAEHVLEVASETVPLETGFLRDRGAVFHLGFAQYEVNYNVEYAEIQHESFPRKRVAGRRMRWLALTIEEQRVKVRELVRDHLGRFGFGKLRGFVSDFEGAQLGVGFPKRDGAVRRKSRGAPERRPEGYFSPNGYPPGYRPPYVRGIRA